MENPVTILKKAANAVLYETGKDWRFTEDGKIRNGDVKKILDMNRSHLTACMTDIILGLVLEEMKRQGQV